MRGAKFFVVVAGLLFSGCAVAKAPLKADQDREVLSGEEIQRSNATDAYDAVRKLRGNFLSYRGPTSLAGTSSPNPTVYVDDQAYGPLTSLRNIPAAQVSLIRLYRSWEATQKFGTGNMGGVIAVYTKQ
jgi:outer membrane cobalamin receptor